MTNSHKLTEASKILLHDIENIISAYYMYGGNPEAKMKKIMRTVVAQLPAVESQAAYRQYNKSSSVSNQIY